MYNTTDAHTIPFSIINISLRTSNHYLHYTGTCTCHIQNLGNQNLFLLLQLIHHRYRYIERISHDVGRGQSEPLGQTNIGHAITLVEFNPDQLFGFGCVLNVVSCREKSASGKYVGRWGKGRNSYRCYQGKPPCRQL